MNRIRYVLALVAALVGGGVALGSDPVGGYLLVDKVVLSPAESPTTIQVWGAFCMASRYGGKAYSAPRRGYLYFKAASGSEGVCRKEWNDLKKMAGTGQVIGFGSSRVDDLSSQGKVRSASEKAERPDVYPVGNGLVKMDGDRDYAPVRGLRWLPAPRSPGDGAAVAPGAVTLEAAACFDRDGRETKHFLEIAGDNGDKESGTVRPAAGVIKWTPALKVKAGVKYTWSVRAEGYRWEPPAATAAFSVKDRQ